MNINDLDFNNLLLVEKTHGNDLNYGVAYRTPYGAKPLCIILDKVD